ncbi:MAG TPA: hypothetical protein DER01_15295 [Phycisphaerales bacterium]|nr:hypothetical protein [Phycisphaerales bacterium]|tara:strand:- start:2937 stop:3533 length:597 start_codon:yes stop_codon:yes gene_type:complete
MKTNALKTLLTSCAVLTLLMTMPVQAQESVVTIKPDAKGGHNVELAEHEMGIEIKNKDKGDGLIVTELKEPISSGVVTFKLSYQSTMTQPKGYRNGMILMGSKRGAGNLVAVGTLIGGRAHVINVRDKKLLKNVKAEMKNDTKFDAVITVDIDAKTIKLDVNGTTVENQLPSKFLPIKFVGYSVANTSTAFSPITISK